MCRNVLVGSDLYAEVAPRGRGRASRGAGARVSGRSATAVLSTRRGQAVIAVDERVSIAERHLGEAWFRDFYAQNCDRVYSYLYVAADPRTPGKAWVIFSESLGRGIPASTALFWSQTEDGGATWSPVRPVSDDFMGRAQLATGLHVQADGSVLALYTEGPYLLADGLPPWSVQVARLAPGELVWEDLGQAGAAAALPLYVFDPEDDTQPIGTGAGRAVSALGPSGDVHVAWAESGEKASRIRYVRSADGGRTWAPAVDAVHVPGAAYNPRIAVDWDGRVAFVFTALTDDVLGDKPLTTRHWVALLGEDGVWRDAPLTSGFDLRQAFYRDHGIFLGEYYGFAGLTCGFGAAVLAVGSRRRHVRRERHVRHRHRAGAVRPLQGPAGSRRCPPRPLTRRARSIAFTRSTAFTAQRSATGHWQLTFGR